MGNDRGSDAGSGDGNPEQTRTVAIERTVAVEPSAGIDQGGGLPPGTRLGRYRIQALLGQGGMGEVYRAEQLEPVRRTVALKLVRGQRLDTRHLAWFEIERQVLASMQHPAIAQIFDAGATAEGHPFFVMEYIEGLPIHRYCEQHGLDLRQRIALMIQVCEGVQHAHQKGVIHRDLKPGNLLVAGIDGRPHPKLIDFGIATAQGRAMAAQQAAGTPAYMSPEQADPQQTLDVRSDVYSLGVMLGELLTGRRPEGADSGSDGAHTASRTRVRPSQQLRGAQADALSQRARALGLRPGTLDRLLRTELDWVVLKATRHARAERYGSAAELGQDLRAFLDGRPLRAVPPTRGYRLRKFARRYRWPLSGAVAIVASLAAGLGLALYGMQQAEARRQQLEQVSAFQQALLEDMDIEAMGAGILASLQDQTGAAGATGEAAWAALLPAFNGTDVASAMVDAHLLARSRDVIGQRFGDQPTVAAGLLDSVAGVYLRGIGRGASAAEVWAQALELTAGLPDLQAERAAWYAQQASAYRTDGRREEARASLDRGLAEAEAANLPAHATSRLLLDHQRAALAADDGDFETALEGSRRVVERLQTVAGGAGQDAVRRQRLLVTARVEEASSLLRLDRAPEAIGILEALLESENARSGEESRSAILIRSRLAVAYSMARQTDRFEALQRDLHRIQTRRLGRDHPDTLGAANNLALAILQQGRLEDAEAALRQLLADRRRVLGPQHPQTLRTALNFSAVLTRLGRREEAIGLIAEVLAQREATLGPEHPDTLTALGNYSQLVVETGTPADALPLATRLHDARQRLHAPGHLERLRAAEHLAFVLSTLGRHAEALPLAQAALEEARVQPGREQESIWAFLLARVVVGLAGTGERQAAERLRDGELRPAVERAGSEELERRVRDGLAVVGMAL